MKVLRTMGDTREALSLLFLKALARSVGGGRPIHGEQPPRGRLRPSCGRQYLRHPKDKGNGVREFSDGSRYLATSRGWRRIADAPKGRAA